MTLKMEREIVRLAKSILKKYNVCAACLGRQFPYFNPKVSSRERGQELLLQVSTAAPKLGECYLCGGLMSSIEEKARKVVEALSAYEFGTFLIGSKTPALAIEREDSLRSEFKLRGGRNVKAEFTRELVRKVAATMRKKISYQSPEIIAILDAIENTVQVIPKSLHVYGRYLKKARGLPQKQVYGASASVESILANKILAHFGGRKVRFSWIGGEDDDSLVLGNGRPFYAEVVEPARRNLASFPTLNSSEDDIVITELRVVKGKPAAKFRFKVKVLAEVAFDSSVAEDALHRLETNFKEATVSALSTRKGKFAEKKVHSIRIEQVQGKSAKLTIECDGGLNIKKFVSGADEEVMPNISTSLGVGARCERFDILSVDLLDHQP